MLPKPLRGGVPPMVTPLLASDTLDIGGLYGVGMHMSSFLKSVKCSLDLRGSCGDIMAESIRRFREEERAIIRSLLIALGVKVKKD